MRRGAILRALLGASVLAPILWYRLYRGTSAGGETFLIKVGLANDFTDLTVVNGTMYFYEVTAVNSVGESRVSNELSATPSPRDTTPPSTPADLKMVVAGTNQLVLPVVTLDRHRRRRDGRSARLLPGSVNAKTIPVVKKKDGTFAGVVYDSGGTPLSAARSGSDQTPQLPFRQPRGWRVRQLNYTVSPSPRRVRPASNAAAGHRRQTCSVTVLPFGFGSSSRSEFFPTQKTTCCTPFSAMTPS
jgi:hypothetical protein